MNTWSGLDSIPHNHKNFIGTIGVYGNRAANFVVQNSDLILNIGSRLDTRITGGNPKLLQDAKIISVDIDKNELFKKRGLKNYDTFNCDVKDFIEDFISILNKKINILNKAKWIKNVSPGERDIQILIKILLIKRNL